MHIIQPQWSTETDIITVENSRSTCTSMYLNFMVTLYLAIKHWFTRCYLFKLRVLSHSSINNYNFSFQLFKTNASQCVRLFKYLATKYFEYSSFLICFQVFHPGSTRVRRLMALTRTARIFQQYTNGFMQELHRLTEIDALTPKANEGLGLGDFRKKGETMP